MTCEVCGEGPCQFPTFCSGVNASFKTADPAQDTGSLKRIDTTDWLTHAPEPQEWTVPDRLPRRETALFSGEGGAGKSTIGLHLCAAHACGKEWLGSLPEPGASMFVDAEDDEKVIRRRFWHIGKHFGVQAAELADLHIFSLHGKGCALATFAQKTGILTPTKLFGDLLAAARLFQPQTIVLASLANFYTGNENDRGQVTQFIQLMNNLAIEANGTVVLISHPSLLGLSSNSGLSGSTQWHNAVRARMFLQSAKVNGGEDPDPELKKLEFRKNQYGPIATTISLRWREGLFLPEAGPTSFDRAARDSLIDSELATIGARLERAQMFISATPTANNYAPKVLAGEPEAIKHGFTKPELKAALARLLERGRVTIVTYGKASNPHQRLTFYS